MGYHRASRDGCSEEDNGWKWVQSSVDQRLNPPKEAAAT